MQHEIEDKIKSGLDRSLDNNRYRAMEKIEHETQMRLKAFAIENGVYLAPLLVLNFAYFIYAIYQDSILPFGESYPIFSFTFLSVFLISIVLTFFNLKVVKPLISSKIEKQQEELTEDVYVSGNKLIKTKEFNQHIDNFIKAEYKISGDERVKENFIIDAIPLANDDKQFEKDPEPIKLPRIALSTGLCISGAPGKGKSVLINQIIKQIPDHNNVKTVIIDVKGEFVEKFYNPDTDIIICPSDLRSSKFSLYKLIKTKIDTGSIAEILVPDDKTSQDPHWVNAARAVVEGLLLYAAKNELSNEEIYETLSNLELLMKIKDDDEVFPIVANFLRVDNNGNPSKESESIISTAIRKAKALQYLAYLDDLETEEIEFKRWLKNGKNGKLFLLSTENLSKVFAPLYGVITSYLISTILDDRDDLNRDIYFILDELPRLGKALGENLEKGLAVGRSKGLKFVMAIQNFDQLKKEFGDKEADAIFGTTNSYIVFQNFYGAQFLEKFFGKTTVIKNSESISFSAEPMGDRITVSRREQTEALINDAKIQRLEKFEFFAKIEGSKDVLKAKLAPKFIKEKRAERYCENPKMYIRNMEIDRERRIKKIKNRFVNLENAKYRTGSIKVEF
ncbi:type IV secretion system DNA-binding domain-containing protein [Hydrogenimonas thermophila]|uniref:type IV secretory system conjugative DNA transfer family protein n=1 Tax=Hydrogenimonas thermophila TaxID=223786 RepID=UPI0029371ACD|nr:type IV secretion system DNA-binding domain-containing protein [Hydrogenimonas thermophila]WOE70134.1 type IV secretion system DNA-binding domain-containing protein [Hydrogenimonas thermophila]WOE72651.1 type IV secretion system DNA-binding domain-containing protein [Hydrogenimonas thermophila]